MSTKRGYVVAQFVCLSFCQQGYINIYGYIFHEILERVGIA